MALLLLGVIAPTGGWGAMRTNDSSDVLGTMELEPGLHYRGGTQLLAKESGVTFRLPPSWYGLMPPGSRTLYLESPQQPGIGLIALLHGVSPEDMEEHLNEPQVIDEGYVLHPVGSAKRSEARVTARYHSGENTGVALALFGPDDKGILFLFTGPKPELAAYEGLLDELAASTHFLSSGSEDRDKEAKT